MSRNSIRALTLITLISVPSICLSQEGIAVCSYAAGESRAYEVREQKRANWFKYFLYDSILPITLSHKGAVYCVALSNDGTQAVTGSGDNTARLWDSATGMGSHELNHDDQVRCVTFNSDGTQVLTGSDDQTVKLWDTADGKQIHSFNLGGRISCCAFVFDGHILACSRDGTTGLWHKTSRELMGTLQHLGAVTTLGCNQDLTMVIIGLANNTAVVWNLINSRVIKQLNHDEPSETYCVIGDYSGITSACFSHENTHVITGSIDKSIKVWDFKTGEVVKKMMHDRVVTAIAINPDGTRLISGSWDNTAKIWDLINGACIHTLAHEEEIIAVGFTRNGEQAITGSTDRTCKVWDTKSGVLLYIFFTDLDFTSSIATCPGNDLMLAGFHLKKNAKIWDLEELNTIRNFLDETSDDQAALLEKFDRACKQPGRIKASADEWATFKTFPAIMQNILALYLIKPPNGREETSS